jgi:putative membrane protein
MMGWYVGDGGYGWMVVVMLGWVVLIGLAAWALVALTRSTDSSPADEGPTPRQILDRRLAAGEIDHDEYFQRLRLLDSRTGSGSTRAAA